jgi:hypothetical protein
MDILWFDEKCGTHPTEASMTTMISEVYDAFKEANVSDCSARKTAEAIASDEMRFANILTLVMWQMAVLIGGVATLVVKAFT